MSSGTDRTDLAALERSIRKEATRYRSWWRRINWHLLFGSLLVLFVLFLVVGGPALAPRDPMEQHSVIQTEDGWKMPPFAAFTVPGFPLGSDDQGRDLLSRLLHAVRPTMVMVAFVAAIRLVLGTVVGLVAGWSAGRGGRVLDLAIAGALSVPILMVALGAIAAVGAETGPPAFIIGLTITGWGETARIVREQTRGIRGNLYIEAARALGQSDAQILWNHVLRQIMPMVWMLLALEISATLMATAGLGFLGYYLGGDVWIEVADFVAGRITGQPELGQMLATSFSGIATLGAEGLPWAMVSVGTMVFVIVLGFNLLGEGLRLRLSLDKVSQQRVFTEARRGLGWWFEEAVVRPVARLVNSRALRIAATVVVLVVIVGGGMLWWWYQAAALAGGGLGGPVADLSVPGGHLWPAERHDAYGTRYVEVERIEDPEILWVFADNSGFVGGPAVAADGTLYIVSRRGTLYSLNPAGEVLWQVELPADGATAPALSAAGDIYVPDREGGLSCLTPAGELQWRFTPERSGVPVGGPIVAADGVIYYPIGSRVEAVSPGGEWLWEANAPQGYRLGGVSISPDGTLLFWDDVVIDARDGSMVDLGLRVEGHQYVVGADGRTYVLSEHTLSEWQMGETGAEFVRSAAWDARAVARFDYPTEALVTPEGMIWLVYGRFSLYGVWQDPFGRVLGMFSDEIGKTPAAALSDDTLYYCGVVGATGSAASPTCLAVVQGVEEPIWRLPLERGGRIVGGALVPGRLYTALTDGSLLAIGDGQ